MGADEMLLYAVPVGEERAAVPLKGDVTKESIEELLKSEKLPAVIEFTDKNSQKIFSAGIERQVCTKRSDVPSVNAPAVTCAAMAGICCYSWGSTHPFLQNSVCAL